MIKPRLGRREFLAFVGGLSSTLGSRRTSLRADPFRVIAAASQDTKLPQSDIPISVHPDNPKYFLFRGKPRVLIAATEHYGAVVNRPFDFTRYLAEAADKKQTVTRTFLLYRELQSARSSYTSLKVESPDFVSPFPRTGPGKAMDGEPKYNLDKWNSEHFDRLRRFLSLASDLGIVSELTLFSNTYNDNFWALNPLRAANNLQEVGKGEWQEYNTLRDPILLERQIAYARKVIQETSGYDNIYYEICNEPGGGHAGHATLQEVDAWQAKMGEVIREELRQSNRKHLVVGQQAFSYTPHFYQAFDVSYTGSMLDAVNIHPLPNLIYQGHTYQLGGFQSKELNLEQFRDFFLATYQAPKPTISDEDNCASIYRDETGWTIHRKRAWIAIMCGAHYDYIDRTIQAGIEAGSEGSRQHIRTWLKNLSEFIHSFDFIHAKPLPGWIESCPAPLTVATLAKPGEDYVAYFADAREVTDPEAGQPITGTFSVSLPATNYVISFYSPRSGVYSPGLRVAGGDHFKFSLTPFEHDVVLRATRES